MPRDATPALDRAAVALGLAVAAVAVVPAAAAPLWDADVWWILRAGQDLLADGAVPRRNRYGFTAPGHPWVMHEWGFGALYALLVRHGGLGALALPRVAAVALAAGAAAWRCLRDARPKVAAGCVALALAVYGGRFESPRPVGVTYALAVALAAVAFEPAFAWRHAVATTAVVLAWTNAHGSFPLAVALCALGLAAPGGDRRARLGAAALALAATFANPYGAGLHGLALRYVLGGGPVAVVHARILEWWPLWRAPLRAASLPELALAAALAALWLASLRDARWRARAVAGLALLAMALRHNRHLGLAGLVGMALAAGPLESLLARGGWSPRAPSRAWALFAALPLAAGLALWGAVARSRADGDWVDASRQDEDLDALLASLPRGHRVFVELPFTGYAVLRGAAVFFDARNDCYPAPVLRAAMDVNDGLTPPVEALRVLRAHGTTHAVARCASRAERSLAAAPRVAERGGLCLHRVAE